MNEESAPGFVERRVNRGGFSRRSTDASPKRNVNIESAINQSSFQLPVLVAISTADGEEQVTRTFETARAVFGHIFSIRVDPRRQRRAAEKVEGLVPKSAHLLASRDTEYVVIFRAKALFWFTGSAVKQEASRRLLLEHAHDLAKTEQAPFYVLNSRAKKIRAVAMMTGLAVIIPAGLLLKPFVTSWTGEQTRHRTASTSHPPGSGKRSPNQQESVTTSDIDADDAGTDRTAGVSPTTSSPSRHGPPPSTSDPKPTESYDRTISQYTAQMARFARSWPDYFNDRLLFFNWYLNEATAPPRSVQVWASDPQTSPVPMVVEPQASVSNLPIAEQTPTSDKLNT